MGAKRAGSERTVPERIEHSPPDRRGQGAKQAIFLSGYRRMF